MKIADYGKAITSYIESPTTAQKLKSKEKALLLAERDNVNTPDLEQSPDSFLRPGETLEDFDVTFRRPNSIGGRVHLANGSFDFSGMSVPQLRLLYRRYTGFDGPRDSRQLIKELKRLIKGLDEDGIPFSKGGRVHLANGSTPKAKPFTLDQFKDKANIYVGALQNKSLPLADIKSALNKFTQKGIDDGMFTADEAIKVVMDLRSSYRDLAQKQRLRGVVEGIGEVERRDYQDGLSVQTLDSRFPVKNPMSTDFKPLDIPGAALPPLAIGAGIKRLKDTFFSKDKDDDKKEIVPSDDKNNLNLKRGDDPGDPDPLDEITERLLIQEAVSRLKKKEMNPDKRDTRTKLAVDLDLPVTRSGMLEIRKGDYFNKRLQTLKDKGVNFDGYYSVPEIANLLGTKSSSGINSYIQDNNIPTVKKGLFKVVKLNDFLNEYQGTKKRVDLAPPVDLKNLARNDFLKDNKSPLFERFKRLKFEPVSKKEFIPPEIRSIYDKYNLSKIEGGHPFPVEFFTKEFGKKGTLKNKRQFDWIYRNKDKLFNPNDLVLQSKDINQSGGPFYNAIAELKPLYKKLGEYVDKYEGKGAVKNKKDIDAISKLNLDIMKIIGNSKEEVQNFIKENPDSKLTIPKMKTGGLHGAIFDYETGEVELYAPDKQVLFESGAVEDIETEKGTMSGQKLKIAEGFLDVLNQVVDDKQDLAKLLNYFEGKMLPRFQKGGPVYGKYAKQIAGLS